MLFFSEQAFSPLHPEQPQLHFTFEEFFKDLTIINPAKKTITIVIIISTI